MLFPKYSLKNAAPAEQLFQLVGGGDLKLGKEVY